MDIGMEVHIVKNIELRLSNKDFSNELFQEAQEKILFLLKANSYSRFLQSDFCKELVEISSTEDSQHPSEADQEDIIFARDEKNVIKAGTVEKLVERLTYEKHSDLLFHRHFLLTYRSFMTQSDLIEKLWQRFNVSTPELKPEEKEEFEKKTKFVIRLRVIKTLKDWVDHYWFDFEQDKELYSKLHGFVDYVAKTGMSKEARLISETIQRKVEGKEDEGIADFAKQPPTPQIPRKIESIHDIDTSEFARQLTMIEFKYYKAIKPHEFLDNHYNKTERNLFASNIVKMIDWFNRVCLWVATSIVMEDNPKDRASIIKKWIDIGEKCRQLQNFNALMEIIGGLRISSISRLKKTWESVGNRYIGEFNRLEELMSSKQNFKNYREILHAARAPCIPYLGIYLRDLTFIGDGNPNTVANQKFANKTLINFDKRRMVASLINEKMEYQQGSYNFKEVPLICDYMQNCQHYSENTLYKTSLILEPKQKAVE